LDCKTPGCQSILDKAPKISDSLCGDCVDHQTALLRDLDALKIQYEVDPRLVRGFDYYTRTVFEVLSMDLGSQNAVLGGGRYDHLVHDLGGPEVPAVGFSSGLDRLIQLVGSRRVGQESRTRTFMITLGDEARSKAWTLLHDIRKAGGSLSSL